MSWVNRSVVFIHPRINTFELDGYEFLMQNCASLFIFSLESVLRSSADHSGDRICIFGFSRGAYTARR